MADNVQKLEVVLGKELFYSWQGAYPRDEEPSPQAPREEHRTEHQVSRFVLLSSPFCKFLKSKWCNRSLYTGMTHICCFWWGQNFAIGRSWIHNRLPHSSALVTPEDVSVTIYTGRLSVLEDCSELRNLGSREHICGEYLVLFCPRHAKLHNMVYRGKLFLGTSQKREARKAS